MLIFFRLPRRRSQTTPPPQVLLHHRDMVVPTTRGFVLTSCCLSLLSSRDGSSVERGNYTSGYKVSEGRDNLVASTMMQLLSRTHSTFWLLVADMSKSDTSRFDDGSSRTMRGVDWWQLDLRNELCSMLKVSSKAAITATLIPILLMLLYGMKHDVWQCETLW